MNQPFDGFYEYPRVDGGTGVPGPMPPDDAQNRMAEREAQQAEQQRRMQEQAAQPDPVADEARRRQQADFDRMQPDAAAATQKPRQPPADQSWDEVFEGMGRESAQQKATGTGMYAGQGPQASASEDASHRVVELLEKIAEKLGADTGQGESGGADRQTEQVEALIDQFKTLNKQLAELLIRIGNIELAGTTS